MGIDYQCSKVQSYGFFLTPLFHIRDTRIEVVQEYKYLGVVLSANESLKQAVSTLSDQAIKESLLLLECRSRFLHFLPPLIMCHLFDSFVLPIMEYVCEQWGFYQADKLEQLQKQFCKFVLHVMAVASGPAGPVLAGPV